MSLRAGKSDASATLVSVVIANWNGASIIAPCLESVRHQTYSSREVIVVDNGSTDGSIEFIRERFPEFEIVALPENRGFAEGVNEGIRRAGGEFIALLNTDAEATPDWLERCVSVMRSDLSIAGVAVKMVRSDASDRLDSAGNSYSAWGIPFPRGRDEPTSRFSDSGEVFAISGGACLLRTEAIERAGYFSESFFMYNEDVDLSFRLRLLGYRIVYEPNAIVRHELSATSGGGYNPLIRYHSVKNSWAILVRNMPSSLFWKCLPRFLLAQILVLGNSLRRGLTLPNLRALSYTFKNLPILLRERRNIQRAKAIESDEIWRLITLGLPPFYRQELRGVFGRTPTVRG